MAQIETQFTLTALLVAEDPASHQLGVTIAMRAANRLGVKASVTPTTLSAGKSRCDLTVVADDRKVLEEFQRLVESSFDLIGDVLLKDPPGAVVMGEVR